MLHLAPHPDDELIGSPASLMMLRDRGWRVVNLACGLGRKHKQRRERELRNACRLARFEVLVSDLVYESSPDLLEQAIADTVWRVGARLVVSPSPHDGHPTHEQVGRAAVAACERLASEPPASRHGLPRLWLWGIWADLSFPTLLCPFDELRLEEVLRCLEAHAGEIRRNDYRRLVSGRAQMNAVIGCEKIFGFGAPSCLPETHPYAELLSEVVLDGGRWRLGEPRILDPEDPFMRDETRSERRDEPAAGAKSPRSSDRHRTTIDDWLRGPRPKRS